MKVQKQTKGQNKSHFCVFVCIFNVLDILDSSHLTHFEGFFFLPFHFFFFACVCVWCMCMCVHIQICVVCHVCYSAGMCVYVHVWRLEVDIRYTL